MTAEEFASLIPPLPPLPKWMFWTDLPPGIEPPIAPPPPVVKHGCQYLSKAFEPGRLIDDAKRILGGLDFDTVVGTGLSGTIGATLIAFALKKHLLIVRKEADTANHSGWEVEGRMGRRWIFVDDLVSSGDTRTRVKYKVSKTSEKFNNSPIFVGTYTYGESFAPAMFDPS